MTITSLPSGSFFLENIPDIDILTAKTRLLVTIQIGDDTIYDEYLYPADGEIRVSDLADIFRPYARRRLAVTSNRFRTPETPTRQQSPIRRQPTCRSTILP